MIKQVWPYSLLVILVFVFGASVALMNHEEFAVNKEIALAKSSKPATYPSITLVDPEQAPQEIREQVLYGYRIVTDTPHYAKENVGGGVSCRNCHFEGGNTLGGKNNSISLVGVSHVYPKFSKRKGGTINLGERINNCFMRSMNGKPLKLDSKEMRAMIAYFDWISTPVNGYKEFPWLGLPALRDDYKPNASRGEKVYIEHCSACHGANGEGTKLPAIEETLDIPPLWGSESFNDGAGMNKLSMIAPFILLNMPFKEPLLTEEEALDVGEYIIKQPRPRFRK